jgi:hypothetical protein
MYIAVILIFLLYICMYIAVILIFLLYIYIYIHIYIFTELIYFYSFIR